MNNRCTCLCHILPSTNNNVHNPQKCNCCLVCDQCKEKLVENFKELDYRTICPKDPSKISDMHYHKFLVMYHNNSPYEYEKKNEK